MLPLYWEGLKDKALHGFKGRTARFLTAYDLRYRNSRPGKHRMREE
jgi:hypothetical protein